MSGKKRMISEHPFPYPKVFERADKALAVHAMHVSFLEKFLLDKTTTPST